MSEAKEYLERIKLYDAIVDSGVEELAMLRSNEGRRWWKQRHPGQDGRNGRQDR